MRGRMKRLSVILVLVFLLQDILMPALYANAATDVVMEISVPQLILTNLGDASDSIELVWTSTDNLIKASSYEIYRDNSLIKTVGNFTYTDSGLSPQTKYSYVVKAKNPNSEVIAESNVLSVTTSLGAVMSDEVGKLTGSAISIEQPVAVKDGEIFKVGNSDFITNRFIVKYKNENGKKLDRKVLEKVYKTILKDDVKNSEFKADFIGDRFDGDFVIITLKENKTLREFTEVLEKNKVAADIEYIQPDYQLSLSSNDTYYSRQWGLEKNVSNVNNTASAENKILHRYLRKSIDMSPELKSFLKITPVEKIKDRIKSGNVPKDINVNILLAIANEPEIITEQDSDTKQQPYVCGTGSSEAWEKSTGNGVTVAVIDTGIDTAHEDLAENIWVNKGEIPDNGIDDDANGKIDDVNGWNFSDSSNIVCDNTNINNENHGTHVAGIISAAKDNQKGIAGVAPASKIMSLKVFKDGKAYTSNIINAIQYAESMGAKIVNCSWCSTNDNPALKETIQNSDMLFVCAAGNNSADIDSSPIYPAAFDCPNIITVASVNKGGQLSGFSNYGVNSVDVAAPGEGIYSTFVGNKYDENSGTSMAAGFVSGEAALLLSNSAHLSAAEIKERIIKYSDHLTGLSGKINQTAKINCINSIKDKSSQEMLSVSNMAVTQSLSDLTGTTQSAINLTSSKVSMRLFSESVKESQFIKIAAGENHSLALRNDGTVWAAGDNEFGQLGDGTTELRSSPVQVKGLTGIKAIACAGVNSMALKEDGTVWIWGNRILTPVRLSLVDIKDIALGTYIGMFALKNDGTVWKQLDSTPQQVNGLDGVTAIAVGNFHCLALRNDGSMWSWGRNDDGQLGYDTGGRYVEEPIQITYRNIYGAKAIACGAYHSVAIGWGEVLAWGSGGVLGNGSTQSTCIPTAVYGLSGINGIKCGASYSMAIKDDGTVWGWGSGILGIGNGNYYGSATAVQVSNLSGITDIACGDFFTLALNDGGQVYGFGDNRKGQLGDGNKDTMEFLPKRTYFVAAPGLSVTKNVSCVSGNPFNLVIKLKNMKSISDHKFTITYNPSDISAVTDLCKMTYKKETTAVTIDGTGITILKNEPGTIVFGVIRNIPENKSWSGVANIIEFKPAVSGQVTFNCKVE